MALRKGEQTREAILWAAIVRFGRDGYRSTAVADIARDAAVSGTLAYAYFPNKEALFLAAVDEDAAAGLVRSDIDAAAIANGMVTIILSLLMSVVQLGGGAAGTYGSDVTAVFEAALGRAGAGGRRRPGRSSTARPPRR